MLMELNLFYLRLFSLSILNRIFKFEKIYDGREMHEKLVGEILLI
jgi:hypothetical protein